MKYVHLVCGLRNCMKQRGSSSFRVTDKVSNVELTGFQTGCMQQLEKSKGACQSQHAFTVNSINVTT